MLNSDDWFMKQIRGVANMVGRVLNLGLSQLDLGSVEDEDGNLIKGATYLDNLLEEERFSEATRFIKSKMKVLNNHEYTVLVDNYIKYLLALDEKVLQRNHLDKERIYQIKDDLNEFEW